MPHGTSFQIGAASPRLQLPFLTGINISSHKLQNAWGQNFFPWSNASSKGRHLRDRRTLSQSGTHTHSLTNPSHTLLEAQHHGVHPSLSEAQMAPGGHCLAAGTPAPCPQVWWVLWEPLPCLGCTVWPTQGSCDSNKPLAGAPGPHCMQPTGSFHIHWCHRVLAVGTQIARGPP